MALLAVRSLRLALFLAVVALPSFLPAAVDCQTVINSGTFYNDIVYNSLDGYLYAVRSDGITQLTTSGTVVSTIASTAFTPALGALSGIGVDADLTQRQHASVRFS